MNMQELRRVLNIPQYGWICLNRMWICLNMSKLAIIKFWVCLIQYSTSARSFYKLMSAYWEKSIFSTLSKIGRYRDWKNNYSFELFSPNTPSLHHRTLHERVLNMCQVLNISGFWIFQEFQYARVLNLKVYTMLTYFCKYEKVLNIPGMSVCPGFLISMVTQGVTIFANIAGFQICAEMQLWKGSEYSRILNIPGFCKCKQYIKFWICLNNAWIDYSDYGRVMNVPG